MQTVTSRDGTRIAYERTGTGAPLVFVHGGWDGHAIWWLVLPTLAQQFTVYAMDRRGCGQSDPYRNDYSVEHDFEDVAAVLGHVGHGDGERLFERSPAGVGAVDADGVAVLRLVVERRG